MLIRLLCAHEMTKHVCKISHLNSKRLLRKVRKLQKMLGGYFIMPHPVYMIYMKNGCLVTGHCWMFASCAHIQGTSWHCTAVSVRWVPVIVRLQSPSPFIGCTCQTMDQDSAEWQVVWCCWSADLEQVASFHTSDRGLWIFQETVESTFVWLSLWHLVTLVFRCHLQMVLFMFVVCTSWLCNCCCQFDFLCRLHTLFILFCSMTHLNSGVIQIYPVHTSDSGIYRCRGSNAAGTRSGSEIQVITTPGIVSVQFCVSYLNVHCGSKKTRQLWQTITTTHFNRF